MGFVGSVGVREQLLVKRLHVLLPDMVLMVGVLPMLLVLDLAYFLGDGVSPGGLPKRVCIEEAVG